MVVEEGTRTYSLSVLISIILNDQMCCSNQSSSSPSDSYLLKDAGELTEVLCEFDAVIEDFSSPVNERHFQYEEHLQRMKWHSSASVSDCSGISDSESEKLVDFNSPSVLLHIAISNQFWCDQ